MLINTVMTLQHPERVCMPPPVFINCFVHCNANMQRDYKLNKYFFGNLQHEYSTQGIREQRSLLY